MPKEIALFDALVPSLVPAFLAASLLMLLLDRAFAKSGLYRRIWYPALFRASLFFCLFFSIGLCIY
ncbi:MAG: DUF1656 domain-containing protein [Burkholderiales bacterium]|nr:DUF1656 domain-containing protein [Burkholderiales bacterium]